MDNLNSIYSIVKNSITSPVVSIEYLNSIEKNLILFFLMNSKYFTRKSLMVFVLINVDYIA